MGIAGDIIIIILSGLVMGYISHLLRLPLILGYIISGIVIGPYTGGITVSNIDEISVLSEIGVALLLFSIGIDLSIKEIKEVKLIALIGTPIQLLVTGVYGYYIGNYFSFNNNASVVLGMVISLSSTMIVIKSLMNLGLISSLSGRVMLGILVVQDLAAVPLMIIIPQLKHLETSLNLLGFTLLKGIAVIFIIVVLGGKIMPIFLRTISRLNSRELFLLTITALGLGIGFFTHLAGLSFALGAFITGVVLNGSEYSHKAMSDIIPLRDIFGLIFFTSIGMLFDPVFFQSNIKIILLLVSLVILGKFIIFMIISRVFGYINVVPLAVGFGLSQIGEFSFVLAKLGLEEKLFDAKIFSIILSTSVLTLLISPFLLLLTSPIYSTFRRIFPLKITSITKQVKEETQNEIIIAGGGRVANSIAQVLHGLGFKFILIENDYKRFEVLKKKGFNCIFGDSSKEIILQFSNLSNAKLLIITVPIVEITKDIINVAKKINPNLTIIVRCNDIDELEDFYNLNISQVVQPEFEASLEMTRQALLHLEISVEAIQSYLDEVRRQKYTLPTNKVSEYITSLNNASRLLEMYWFHIEKESILIGKKIGELALRKKLGITVIGVYRKNELIQNPDIDFSFEKDDMIALIGSKVGKEKFEELFEEQE
jgi:monovalent cation:H+ antiporter-2, CPA2 family